MAASRHDVNGQCSQPCRSTGGTCGDSHPLSFSAWARLCGWPTGPRHPYRRGHVCAGVQRLGRSARRLCHVIDIAIRRWEMIMDKNRIEGTKHEVKGAVKEAAGKVTGNPVKEASGQAEKQVGKFQKEVGKSRDDYKKHT